jgi:hypothetical protein
MFKVVTSTLLTDVPVEERKSVLLVNSLQAPLTADIEGEWMLVVPK